MYIYLFNPKIDLKNDYIFLLFFYDEHVEFRPSVYRKEMKIFSYKPIIFSLE